MQNCKNTETQKYKIPGKITEKTYHKEGDTCRVEAVLRVSKKEKKLKASYRNKKSRSFLRVVRSETSCLALGESLCHSASSCDRILASKEWNKPFCSVNSVVSSDVTAFFSSRIQEFIATSRAFCMDFMLLVSGCESSMTSGDARSSTRQTKAWKRGHRYSFFTYNLFKMFSTLLNPDEEK